MKKLLFLGACLVALASAPVKAQTGEPDIVVVKMTDGYYQPTIFDIARPGKPPEHRVLNKKDLEALGSWGTLAGAAEATRRLLVELAQQGYSLSTTYSAGSTNITTMVFTKRQ
jgi:hypothetical protein